MRTVATRMLIVVGLLCTAGLAFPLPTHAVAPTRIVDRSADVVCTAVSEGVEITVGAARSELAGTDSRVQLSYASTGETIGDGRSTSDWGDGMFRAAIPVLGRGPEEGQPVGEVYFSGGFTPVGDPQQSRDKFKVGNVQVVEEHIETLVAVSDVALTYDDNDAVPGDITFSDLTCEGSLVEGSLFFTNPATLVQFWTDLVFFADDCAMSNVEEFTIEGSLDELFVEVTYADRLEATASGLIVPERGTWQGEFRLRVSDEPVGTVPATAMLERGRPFHATDEGTGMRAQFQVTPYHFTLEIVGRGAPAELDCTLFQVRQKLHLPNPSG